MEKDAEQKTTQAPERPQNYSCIMFAANVVLLDGEEDLVKLCEDAIFRKASASEESAILDFTKRLTLVGTANLGYELPHSTLGKERDNPKMGAHVLALPSNHETTNWERAGMVAPQPVQFIWEHVYFHDGEKGGWGTVFKGGVGFSFFGSNDLSRPPALVHVDKHDLAAMAELKVLLDGHDDSVYDLSEPFLILMESRKLPSNSHARFLSVFSVLESLITHKPDPNGDTSITKQVKRKMSLLERRFSVSLDYEVFGDANRNQVWNALYSVRSQIAHGARPSFECKNTKRAKNLEVAYQFVESATSAVIRQVLCEPQLLADLRAC